MLLRWVSGLHTGSGAVSPKERVDTRSVLRDSPIQIHFAKHLWMRLLEGSCPSAGEPTPSISAMLARVGPNEACHASTSQDGWLEI